MGSKLGRGEILLGCLPRKIKNAMINENILASLRKEINEQTAQMRWIELERFFASGSVIWVAGELDLIDVGARIAADDKDSTLGWMNAGLVKKVTDEQASSWHQRDAVLWTAVVKPWILVQHERQMPSPTTQ
ncbi:MAG: hypothetical protein RL564_1406 [Pseudomonadota bacterium]|jgi:hypothetical protein